MMKTQAGIAMLAAVLTAGSLATGIERNAEAVGTSRRALKARLCVRDGARSPDAVRP